MFNSMFDTCFIVAAVVSCVAAFVFKLQSFNVTSKLFYASIFLRRISWACSGSGNVLKAQLICVHTAVVYEPSY